MDSFLHANPFEILPHLTALVSYDVAIILFLVTIVTLWPLSVFKEKIINNSGVGSRKKTD